MTSKQVNIYLENKSFDITYFMKEKFYKVILIEKKLELVHGCLAHIVLLDIYDNYFKNIFYIRYCFKLINLNLINNTNIFSLLFFPSGSMSSFLSSSTPNHKTTALSTSKFRKISKKISCKYIYIYVTWIALYIFEVLER